MRAFYLVFQTAGISRRLEVHDPCELIRDDDPRDGGQLRAKRAEARLCRVRVAPPL
jgi:hypothetical protein